MIQWDYVDKLEHSTDRDRWSVEATHEKALDFDIMKKRGCCCCCLPDPFRGMGAWRKTMEPQKPGNSPGSGPEVIKRQRVAKE